jgi:hypothetical protein
MYTTGEDVSRVCFALGVCAACWRDEKHMDMVVCAMREYE